MKYGARSAILYVIDWSPTSSSARMLRFAKPGIYRVEANYFGSAQQIVTGATTLQLRFTTGFGTPKADDKLVSLRLTGQGSTVLVGEFEVKPK